LADYNIVSALTGAGRVDAETEARGLDEIVHGEKNLNLLFKLKLIKTTKVVTILKLKKGQCLF